MAFVPSILQIPADRFELITKEEHFYPSLVCVNITNEDANKLHYIRSAPSNDCEWIDYNKDVGAHALLFTVPMGPSDANATTSYALRLPFGTTANEALDQSSVLNALMNVNSIAKDQFIQCFQTAAIYRTPNGVLFMPDPILAGSQEDDAKALWSSTMTPESSTATTEFPSDNSSVIEDSYAAHLVPHHVVAMSILLPKEFSELMRSGPLQAAARCVIDADAKTFTEHGTNPLMFIERANRKDRCRDPHFVVACRKMKNANPTQIMQSGNNMEIRFRRGGTHWISKWMRQLHIKWQRICTEFSLVIAATVGFLLKEACLHSVMLATSTRLS